MTKATARELSDGSDDEGLMGAVAKQVQNTLQKRRKDNEVKFLASAKLELARSTLQSFKTRSRKCKLYSTSSSCNTQLPKIISVHYGSSC
ncbi:hypothetical protein BC835DRAFT_721545 [Cytidiella melzeri]|nr:hypothetical protein BC835DRAFT_721545 [Cytidiella melzeri]